MQLSLILINMYALKIVIIAFVAVALAAEDATKPDVEVLTEKAFLREDGYNFEYRLSDGGARKEEGEVITVGDYKGIGVKGSYSYVAPDGQEYTVTYTADDKGFNPKIHVKPATGN